MSTRITQRPEGVSAGSAWPYAVLPEKKNHKVRRGWTLAISIDPDLVGLVAYYPNGPARVLHIDNGTPSGKRIPLRPFYQVADKEAAEKFAFTFCSRGYGKSLSLLPDSDGEMWGFNWCSLTLATVRIASQVADHFFNDRRDAAWAVGKAFGDQIHAAENAAYDARQKKRKG
jgi:hypothetical protein